jgi:hypothetical protein
LRLFQFFTATIISLFRSLRLGAIFEGWRGCIPVTGKCGAERKRWIFLEEVFQERERWFSLRFWPTRTRRARFAGFLRKLQVGRERNAEHSAHGAQDAAQTGVFAQERTHVGVVEKVHQLRAGAGDLVAGE